MGVAKVHAIIRLMNDGLKKFFDPKSLPKTEQKTVALDYFMRVRTKLCLTFVLPDAPDRLLQWDDPKAVFFLEEYRARGGTEVLVDLEQYNLKIKNLARL